jgi:hypothetical protein
MMDISGTSLTLSFQPSAAQAEVIEQFAFVAPIFLKDKGVCLVILPPDAKSSFDDWLSRNLETEDYDGIATLGDGFFGIRLKDRADRVREILDEIGVLKDGRYIIAHRPARKGRQISYSTLAL